MEEAQEKLKTIYRYLINYLLFTILKMKTKLDILKQSLLKPISPLYFNDKKRACALISPCSILNILLPESQPNKNIYKSFEGFLNSLNIEEWIFSYIFFELNLIKDLGYDPNLIKFKRKEINVSNISNIKIDSFSYEVPEYLILKKIPKNYSNFLIKKSLFFTRSLIQNKFFIPNKIPFPNSRIQLENYFK